MSSASLAVVLALALSLVVALVLYVRRVVIAIRAERTRRRVRLNRTLAEVQLQHLTYLALARLLDEARQSLTDSRLQP